MIFLYPALMVDEALAAAGVETVPLVSHGWTVAAGPRVLGTVRCKARRRWLTDTPSVAARTETYQRRTDGILAVLRHAAPQVHAAVIEHLDGQLVAARSPIRPCASCNETCTLVDDAWRCLTCGDEWYPDHGTVYALTTPAPSAPT